MKSVLISIRPEWCSLIASDKKKIEIRKSKPIYNHPFKVYIYCTNHEPRFRNKSGKLGNGKVIGEFICRRIDEYNPIEDRTGAIYWLDDKSFEDTGFENLEDLCEYGSGKRLYGWHISDLVIYDIPNPLSEFGKCGYDTLVPWKKSFVPWKRPPQSWGYCERRTR
jgi:predicted transcriptional regulator